MAITDFLKTNTTRKNLLVALKVLREFRTNESKEEWMATSFDAWAKLEQLEEFLDNLVNGAPLREDTMDYIKRMEAQ